MDLEESMEAYIKMLSRNYDIAEVRYDPFQFHRSASTLAKDGINMVEWPQTNDALAAYHVYAVELAAEMVT